MVLFEHLLYDSDYHQPVALCPSDRTAAAFELQVLSSESGRPLSRCMLHRRYAAGAYPDRIPFFQNHTDQQDRPVHTGYHNASCRHRRFPDRHMADSAFCMAERRPVPDSKETLGFLPVTENRP